MTRQFNTRPGSQYPPGATPDENGINFCIFSRNAEQVELRLYKSATCAKPFQVIALDPHTHRTFFFWHIYVEKLPLGTHYTWRVDGPGETRYTGFRFDKRYELLDPWAKAITDTRWDRRKSIKEKTSLGRSMRAIAVKNDYDWENDKPINHAMEDSIIYELHVGGFTLDPSSNVKHPGTFSGLIEKIPYLKELGITDVELMPVMAFDEQDVPDSVAARNLKNYWGYSTHSFFSPHPRYCVSSKAGNPANDFRDMVKAFHQQDIGVVLDVVINHTSEGNEHGPTINFKGLFNEIFYHLDEHDKRRYRDYTGCGNTINCNHPMVTRYLMSCLGYWVKQMHVDGFRFDLASVFSRGENGHPLYNAPLPWNIEFSRSLAHTKVIAEAWDAAGLYQVGAFPGYRWSEWNGRYRDIIRRFIRGDKGIISDVATCISGSSDMYEHEGKLPINSINFVTCHDGFTLYDLVSYNHKHNEVNGENNRDGHNDNLSWNCGVEGPTHDIQIETLRRRQAKNIMAILFLSQGVPMIQAGDEILRTQRGNNNAYCQNNALTWFDWRMLEQRQDMFRFVKALISFRKRNASLRRRQFLTGTKMPGSPLPDITWHGPRLNEPLWDDPDAQILGFTLAAQAPRESHLHVVMNMSPSTCTTFLPEIIGTPWFLAIDTFAPSPSDIIPPEKQKPLKVNTHTLGPRSICVFEARNSLSS